MKFDMFLHSTAVDKRVEYKNDTIIQQPPLSSRLHDKILGLRSEKSKPESPDF